MSTSFQPLSTLKPDEPQKAYKMACDKFINELSKFGINSNLIHNLDEPVLNNTRYLAHVEYYQNFRTVITQPTAFESYLQSGLMRYLGPARLPVNEPYDYFAITLYDLITKDKFAENSIGDMVRRIKEREDIKNEIFEAHKLDQTVHFDVSDDKELPISIDKNVTTISILNRPYHMGDNNVSQYENPNPEGIEFKSFFSIPFDDISDAAIIISVSDMVPNRHKEFLKGSYKNKLYINNAEIAVINSFIQGTEDKLAVEDINIYIPKNLLKKGNNEIKIVAGYRADKNNYDDFQIHKIQLHISDQ